jgi:hypothetical protein
MASDSPEPNVVNIAKIFTTEMSNRIMSNVHTAIAAIHDGPPSPLLDQKISEFENRMRLKTNVISLKRKIAKHVYNNNGYPY